MEILFNQYGNMEEISLYLCNPNRDEIDMFEASNRAFTLRFNDLSEFTCEVSEEYAHYDFVETKRLIYAEHIGWFQIIKVDENDDGVHKTKTVTAESHQAELKNFGFTVEERTYCFYNADDKYDANYDANNSGDVPSVVGQLYRQAGIKCELSPSYSEFEPIKDYEDWTIIYIAPSLIGKVFEKSGTYRSFNKGNKYVYEFINADVSDAFQVIFDFDILHHAIKIKTADEITERTSIYLTHENLIQAIDVSENAEDIVTVLDCKGTNLDITLVNPMGTNYIVDFSYYMMEKDGQYPWMTKPLIDALTEWKTEYYSEENILAYSQLTQAYSGIYETILPYEEELQYNSLKSKDIGKTRDNYAKGSLNENSDFTFEEISISYTKDNDGELQATVDRVEIYKNSASYYKMFDDIQTQKENIRTQRFTFYNTRPTSNGSGGFNYAGAAGTTMTLDEAFAALNITEQSALDDGEINIDNCYKYFKDDTTNRSYCELKGAAIVDGSTGEATYRCGGYKRICLCMYAGESVEAYIDRNNDINTIVGDKDDSPSKYADNNQPTSPSLYYRLNSTHEQMREISESVSLVNYFSNKEDLYRELKCYWVEGEYTDEHLSAEDTTTIVEQIKLARELMNNGFDELEKVCQPKFSFSISLVNFIKIYKYRHFTQELALGKIITIQKDDSGEGVHYYPALTELSFNLDNSDDFTLTFSNAYKMNDWGYTFSDLLAKSSSISRQVASNWEVLTKYANEKEDIMSLVNNSLDSTLRAANSNLFAQEFIIDETGVLGRKYTDAQHRDFDDRQIRIINNMIMFTKDKWKTINVALGEISFPDNTTSYGLVADTVVGKVFLGNEMLIQNKEGTVFIDDAGIRINKKLANSTVTVFKADADGNLELTGTIYAESGTIGGFKIEDSFIYNGLSSLNADGDGVYIGLDGINIGNALKVDSQGNAILQGTIYAESGTIGGFKIGKTPSGYISSGDSIFTELLELREDGSVFIYQEGKNSQHYECFRINSNGIYRTTTDMKLGRSTMDIQLTKNGLSWANGSIYLYDNGYMWLDAGTDLRLRVKNTDMLQVVYGGIDSEGCEVYKGYLKQTWYLGSSTPVTSDLYSKKEIEPISAKYEELFDGLKPVRYKYIDGTSGRYHTGFIAQDVKGAITGAGLDTSQAAMYVEDTHINDDGTETTKCYLRYEEFIALCVHEIQKLKNEIKELKGNI